MHRALFASALVALAVMPVLVWHLDPPAWEASATCLPDECFCERLHDGGVRQPANTWSSLGFVGLAVGVVLTQRRSRFVGLFVVACFALGVTSAYFHASLSFVGQWLDVLSMYLLVTVLGLHAVLRAGLLSVRTTTLLGVGLLVATAILSGAWPDSRRFIFGGLILALVVAELTLHKKAAFPAVLVFAASYVVWTLDIERLLCVPDSLLQGHAVWHLGCVAATGLLFQTHTRAA